MQFSVDSGSDFQLADLQTKPYKASRPVDSGLSWMQGLSVSTKQHKGIKRSIKDKMIIALIISGVLFRVTLGSPLIGGYNYERNSLGDNRESISSFLTPFNTQNILSNSNHQSQRSDLFGNLSNKYLPASAATSTTTAAPIITKQFFLVSAPEDEDDLPRTKHLILGRPQRNYRVVFIKAPHSGNANLRLTAEYAPQEEKTVIYVLTKKAKELEVNDIATPAPVMPSKPEVFFIKYKTQAEAEAARKEIQAHYDQLGGTSQFSDEGVAPVKSVVGSLERQQLQQQQQPQQTTAQASQPSASSGDGGYHYNPPNQNSLIPTPSDFLQPAKFYY